VSILHWVKGQIADVKAMEECILQRANLIAQIPKIKARRNQLARDHESAVVGRTTFKTFFKSTNEKKSYA
jgi:hypothetical protein